MLFSLQRGREWIWITGNHDPETIENVGGEFAEVFKKLDVIFRHLPGDGDVEVIGHFHPVARVSCAGGRCAGAASPIPSAAVLPAFGSLTGGFNIRELSFASLMGGDFFAHMLGSERLFSFAAAHCLPD